MPKAVLLLLTALAAAPLHAAPLTFGEIDGRQDFSRRPELAVCSSKASGFDCVLTRNSFGGLPLSQGRMVLDAWGRVRSLQLELDREDYERARTLLVGRYGKPASLEPRSLWNRFDDDARISLSKGRPRTLVMFDYPRNDAAAYDLRPSVIWTLLLFTLGGLAIGALLRRARQRRPTQPVSMKQTLERRMREGRELNF
jgi:hypothetical protein